MHHRAVTCDSVFEILTRGPFPRGGQDDAWVERHLAACHDCRCLAEALRPAVALMHESVASAEAQELPRYHGLPSDLAKRRSFFSQPTATVENRWGFTPAGVTAVASLLSCVVALAAVLHWSAPPHQHQRTVPHANKAQLDIDGAQLLLALALHETCAPAAPLTAIADGSTDGSVPDCCTQCHSLSRSRSLSSYAMHTMARSCKACHG